MNKRKKRIIVSCANVFLILVYVIPMFYFGEGSVLDAFFPYFMTLIIIFGTIPIINADTEALCASERKIRIILGSLAFASVAVPAIVFLSSGMEVIRQITVVTNFWRSYPYKIVVIYGIITLVVMVIYKHREKNK